MTNHLPEIASRMLNTTLLLHPQKAEVLLWVLGPRIGIDERALPDVESQPDASRFVGSLSGGGAYSVERGAAIIPVMGTLVNRGAWTGAYSGMTSYEGLEASINRALADDAVSRIVLDINSPGGEATGMARIAEAVRRAKAKKPVIALVNDMAASAAYAIASQADRILISETSLVGSIGVLWVHFDHSKALAEKGVKPTIIHAGARKVDGNPYGPLPDTAREGIEEEINSIYAVFIGQVIKGRSSLSVGDVREMEARTFTGRAAIDNGLADAMGNIEDAITMQIGGSNMSDNSVPAANAGISQEDYDEAVAAARTEGAVEATNRIKAIFALKETQGREASAQVFALETDMSAEAAAMALAATPKTSPSNDSKVDEKAIAAAKIAAAGASNIVGPDDVAEPPKQAVIDTDAIYASRRV